VWGEKLGREAYLFLGFRAGIPTNPAYPSPSPAWPFLGPMFVLCSENSKRGHGQQGIGRIAKPYTCLSERKPEGLAVTRWRPCTYAREAKTGRAYSQDPALSPQFLGNETGSQLQDTCIWRPNSYALGILFLYDLGRNGVVLLLLQDIQPLQGADQLIY
jgi:hypothetical protein